MATPESGALLREVVRRYVQSQRQAQACGADMLSTTRCHILTELKRAGQLSQQSLASRLNLEKSWVSRVVEQMVGDGLLSKAPSPTDKRAVELTLTVDGLGRAQSLEALLNGHGEAVLARLTAAQRDDVDTALQALLQALTPPSEPQP